MLNLDTMSKTFCTLSESGVSAGSIPASYFSKPFMRVIRSKSSMLLLMKSDTSLMRVKIFASVFLSMNFANSS